MAAVANPQPDHYRSALTLPNPNLNLYLIAPNVAGFNEFFQADKKRQCLKLNSADARKPQFTPTVNPSKNGSQMPRIVRLSPPRRAMIIQLETRYDLYGYNDAS